MGPDQTVIRELQRKDCPAVAGLWRELLDEPSATDESVLKTFEKMRRDSRYCTYVAEEDGTIIGFITFVEVLASDAPDGYIKINGGTVSISAQSAFDYELGGELNGGTVTVNGQQVTQITSAMMGGMGGMQPGGQQGGTPPNGGMGGSKGGMRP